MSLTLVFLLDVGVICKYDKDVTSLKEPVYEKRFLGLEFIVYSLYEEKVCNLLAILVHQIKSPNSIP